MKKGLFLIILGILAYSVDIFPYTLRVVGGEEGDYIIVSKEGSQPITLEAGGEYAPEVQKENVNLTGEITIEPYIDDEKQKPIKRYIPQTFTAVLTYDFNKKQLLGVEEEKKTLQKDLRKALRSADLRSLNDLISLIEDNKESKIIAYSILGQTQFIALAKEGDSDYQEAYRVAMRAAGFDEEKIKAELPDVDPYVLGAKAFEKEEEIDKKVYIKNPTEKLFEKGAKALIPRTDGKYYFARASNYYYKGTTKFQCFIVGLENIEGKKSFREKCVPYGAIYFHPQWGRLETVGGQETFIHDPKNGYDKSE